ncbi:hypothetical protein CL91_gp78 [Mycobacterium phage Aeneas]|uniref:DUF7459 domain-containing protein n=2 Tax=Fromanvirus TaxID=186764 RepID=I3WX60_9CAUD|nr:hypothetical protein N854_gp73 [Mycobacterium phage Trouble]YP_009016059.1 hypothetical protein CL67_gp73 [Mycobacterium phage Perseus]YP_009016343.1 hypothetical protein CL91_gp78 [Mycobacterium phage Aeneas]QFP96766.1 hypothetical protein SEA_JACKSPARROW_74 [Mycobacterium phage JackSparrow]AEM91694.1 hypothetical protein PERSEUS_73 [Mycobacterium phage Perseus]AFL48088.1 hypothetical protein AENEAS_78 [Mycobacterium phage Aeneas]AGT12586.1 hypothetical protein TROUBLE_73 [Mycobacterium p
MTDPTICQHHHIDNDTWQCEACGDLMESQSVEARTVTSAPNLAAGSGVYVPDRSNQRTIVLGYKVSYECSRCEYEGSYFSSDGALIVGCGHVHQGDFISDKEAS